MPHALLISDSNIVGSDPSKAQPFVNGWVEVTPEQFAAAKTTPRPQWVDGQVVSGPEPEPVPPMPVQYSKLKLILMLEAEGLEEMFFAWLASDPKLLRRWDAAQYLMSDDPILLAAIPAFAAASGKTESQILELLNSCQ